MPQSGRPERSWSVNAISAVSMGEKSEGGGRTLDSIFRTYYGRVARVIGRVIHDQARAEELAVAVFLKWWRNPGAHGEGAEGWIYRTAVRQALDELRRLTRQGRFERLFRIARDTPASPEQMHAAEVERRNVRSVLAVLEQRHAELLLLRSEGLSYQEIVSTMQLNPSYVGSLLSRAQDAFRKEYVKRYGKQF
jgi:RNA polymerase sigma-70 factor (ECF subfamily)